MSYGASPPGSGAAHRGRILCAGCYAREVKLEWIGDTLQSQSDWLCDGCKHQYMMAKVIRDARWHARLGRWINRRCMKVLERILFG